MSLNYIYCCTGLTGGGTGDLDSLVAANLVDKDMAFAIDQTTVYVYALDDDSGAAESSPDVIKPDDETGNKRWILQSMRVNDITVSDDIILVTDDVNVGGDLAVTGAITGGTIDGIIGSVTPAAITGTTIDATTDFTVGSTVITDGVITDTTGLTITTPDTIFSNGDVYIRNATDDAALLTVGTDGVQNGQIAVMGQNTGSSVGGELSLYVADDYDGTTVRFRFLVNQDDLTIGPSNDSDSLKYTGSNDLWNFTGTGADVAGALTAGTVDADTDFTVGGTVITDGKITDDGAYEIEAATSIALDSAAVNIEDGVLNIGVDDSVRGIMRLYGPAAGAAGSLYMYTAGDDDAGANYFALYAGNNGIFYLGTDDDNDMMTIPNDSSAINFTVPVNIGGTVITDNKITDDGAFEIEATTSIALDSPFISVEDGDLRVGVNGTQYGLLRMYGAETTNTQGGRIDLHPGVDYDTDIGSYRIQVDSDDFQIGPMTDEDAFKFTAAGAAVTAAFNVGLTGTTIDATTDFTVGGTVITDNTITDDGALSITAATSVNFDGAGGIVTIGQDDDLRGQLYLYGGDTTENGGVIRLHTDEGDDTSIEYYAIQIANDDLLIGTASDTNALKFVGTGSGCTIEATVALLGTTIDATTDFTIGGTVITDNTITDDGLLWLTTASGVRVNTSAAAGNPALLYLGVSDSHHATVYLYSDDDTSAPFLNFQVPPDNDGNSTTNWIIGGTDNTDDFVIGANNDTDMMVFEGGANPTIKSTVTAYSAEDTLTSTANSVAWDAAATQCAYHNLTENTTIAAPTNLKAGATYMLRVEGDGASTLSWNAVFEWGAEATPDAPAADGDIIIFSFYTDGTTMYGVEAVVVEA
jgi:hypothetical protein